jgi:hypothetical protein
VASAARTAHRRSLWLSNDRIRTTTSPTRGLASRRNAAALRSIALPRCFAGPRSVTVTTTDFRPRLTRSFAPRGWSQHAHVSRSGSNRFPFAMIRPRCDSPYHDAIPVVPMLSLSAAAWSNADAVMNASAAVFMAYWPRVSSNDRRNQARPPIPTVSLGRADADRVAVFLAGSSCFRWRGLRRSN